MLLTVCALMHSTQQTKEDNNIRVARLPKERPSLSDNVESKATATHSTEEPSIDIFKQRPLHGNFTTSIHNLTTNKLTSSSLPSARLREKFPHFMIIGFGKAGTRALYNALRLHPQLAGPGKEERFFSNKYSLGLIKYLSSFPSCPPGGFLIEKSPDYILNPRVPSRIINATKRVGINVKGLKFVVMTRDPIDRAMSEYLEWKVQRKMAKKPELPSFDKMVLSEGILQTQQPFINASCYAYHIRNWLQTFSEEQMCYVDGDAFAQNPFQQIKSLESCMGIEHFFTEKHFVYNEKRGFYCLQKHTDIQCLPSSKGRTHPDISVDVRTQLLQYFDRCNAGLNYLTGFEHIS